MEEKILDGLKSIVGENNVIPGTDGAMKFLHSGQAVPNLVVVSPSNDEELQKIVDLARENNTAIITANDRYLLEEDLDKEGILLDFSRMNKIERIDKNNLIAHVQRGVTWEQLTPELKKMGVRAAAPVAANSESVAESSNARVIGKSASKYCDFPITNLKIVLANGRIHRTGTHGYNEDGSDGRAEGGPGLSNWFIGADDIYGVMTRASIYLWPITEGRTCLVYAFEDSDAMLMAMRDVPRNELGIEYIGINSVYLKNVLSSDAQVDSPWFLVIGLEGRSKLVDHNSDRLQKLLQSYPCQLKENLVEAMTEQLDLPWMEASDNHTAFMTLFPRLKSMEAEVDRAAAAAGVPEEKIGKVYVSYDYGRSVHAVYDWFTGERQSEAIKSLELSLSDLGAYFDRPHGELGRKIYTSIPNHLPILKHVKSIMDPENIMNPGRIIKDEDPQWQPPKVGNGETGLTVSNVATVKEKLSEAIGADWVSDNPADLSAYGRDFTIFAGERPNIVVLPESAEDVQKIIRIAYNYSIPVVPQTTGFNHGGLTIPRKGGIMVDCRRIEQVCKVDDEAMTVTVNPGIRMRCAWWECLKYRANEDFHLKPILPMTLASVSLLSNYVARGGAGMAAKYGMNTELASDMTWVLPNGEVFKIGASAIPNVGNVPVHYSLGPDLFGMFFNAEGMFGVCTELTAKCYPEKDNVVELEELLFAANFEQDNYQAFVKTVNAIRELACENITDFMYKSHAGSIALGIAENIEGFTVEEAIKMAPPHPLLIHLCAYDPEELEIKKKIMNEILEKYEFMIMDPTMFGTDLSEMEGSTDALKRGLGRRDNFVGSYKGAFQWTACYLKLEKVPQYAQDYEKLVEKYWKTSDPTISVEHSMTGTAIQGPLPLGRIGGVEIDFWWDQGNPEEVKRATQIIHKAHKLMLKHGGFLYRNMFGAGEYHLPEWDNRGEYMNILKETKQAFDPGNLMHPDVLPITDDYV